MNFACEISEFGELFLQRVDNLFIVQAIKLQHSIE